jgi:hypothetical protein
MTSLILKNINQNTSEIEFNYFMELYNENKKDLCLKKNGEKTQDIKQYLQEYSHLELFNYSIYYIIDKSNNNKEKILAFCLISVDLIHKIIDITLLCSNKEKKQINGVSLGKYLLNIIYSTYINEYIIKIWPATAELISYYIGWKNPNFPNTEDTSSYLLYGNLKSSSDRTIKELFNSLKLIDSLKNYLDININTNKINNIDSLKDKLKIRLNEIKYKYNESIYNQLFNMINLIKYTNANNIRNHSIPIDFNLNL